MSANLPAVVCGACREYVSWGRCECEPEPVMPEIEHQPAREGMTGAAHINLRPEFSEDRYSALDAPWLLPLGGVVVHEADGVADCFVEREADDDARIVERAAEIEAAELCRECA